MGKLFAHGMRAVARLAPPNHYTQCTPSSGSLTGNIMKRYQPNFAPALTLAVPIWASAEEERRSWPASSPRQFALSESAEEAWKRAQWREFPVKLDRWCDIGNRRGRLGTRLGLDQSFNISIRLVIVTFQRMSFSSHKLKINAFTKFS